MGGWRRICCVIDFSKGSRAVLREAAHLALGLGAELTLVHVHGRSPLAAADVASAAERLAPAAGQLRRKLDALRSHAEQILRRPVRVAVFGGDPSAELARFARANGFDAVVIGAQGRTASTRLALRSWADRVARGAHCTVVVVGTAPEERVVSSSAAM